jgi:hypothetical protein
VTGTRPVRGVEALEQQLRRQHDGVRPASPLYGRVIAAVLADVRAGGVCLGLLMPYADEPPSHAMVLRFLAAVHRIVLDGRAPALATHYPSAAGAPGPDLEACFLAAVEHNADEVAAGLSDGVQTNEVGRSAALVGGYLSVAAETGLPLRVLEIGASAGLNLLFDRFAYEAGGQVAGDASSPVRFVEPWTGKRRPDLDVRLDVRERRGCDLRPIDPASSEGRLRLRSFVWPDQIDRLARLEQALDLARRMPVTVDRASAPDWLDVQLAHHRPGTATVVTHTIVMQYLTPDEQERMLAVLGDAGGRATRDAPLAWLRMEAAGPTAEIRLTLWPGGHRRVLGTSNYHGPPVDWLG